MPVVPHFEALPFYFDLEEGRPDVADDGRVPDQVLAEVSFRCGVASVLRSAGGAVRRPS